MAVVVPLLRAGFIFCLDNELDLRICSHIRTRPEFKWYCESNIGTALDLLITEAELLKAVGGVACESINITCPQGQNIESGCIKRTAFALTT